MAADFSSDAFDLLDPGRSKHARRHRIVDIGKSSSSGFIVLSKATSPRFRTGSITRRSPHGE
jgi:hypothetical protein